MIPRDYQEAAIDAAMKEFDKGVQSTLVVLPTGTGKMLVGADVIRIFEERKNDTGAVSNMFLAHREELLHQAQRTIKVHTGLECEYELAQSHASEIFPANVLLASVQTLISGRNGSRRINKFSPNNYGVVVVDEAHHGVCKSYEVVFDYMKGNPDIKFLFLTATPNRSDKLALAKICQSVAFDYPIREAMNDGWLVPVRQQLVDIQSLDFSHVRTTAGDLNLGDLGAVMEAERNLYGICDAVNKEIGNRKAIMFTASVKQAEMSCDILNRYAPGRYAWASGKTDKDDRKRIMRNFSEGRYQGFVNCNLVSEGYDVPDADLLVQARPTKSPLQYTQQLGRVMRPLSGIVDGLSTPAERLSAIANSAKPYATVMDFVGNAGRHKLTRAIDVLGGKISDKVRDLAERDARKRGVPVDVDELVEEAEKKEREERARADAARKAKLTARATYTVRHVDPFDAFDLVAPPEKFYDKLKRLTIREREILQRQKLDPDQMTYTQGKVILGEIFRRWQSGEATLGQIRLLKKRGIETKGLTKTQASTLISDIAAREGWTKR